MLALSCLIAFSLITISHGLEEESNSTRTGPLHHLFGFDDCYASKKSFVQFTAVLQVYIKSCTAFIDQAIGADDFNDERVQYRGDPNPVPFTPRIQRRMDRYIECVKTMSKMALEIIREMNNIK